MLVQIILYAIAALIAVGGVLTLHRAAFADRSNGRPRCPRCWQDMTGSRGFICPECGHDAVRQANLHRTRRDGMKAFLGALLLVTGSTLGLVPTVQDEGWTALIPTTALIAAMPWTGSQWVFDEVDARVNGAHPEWFDRRKVPGATSMYQRFFAHRCAAVINGSGRRALRLRAVQLLSDQRLSDDYSERALLAATEDVDPTIRIEAINALIRIASIKSIVDPRRSAERVINCLTDSRDIVRTRAARFLEYLHPPPDVLPALITALSDERTEVRVQICGVLSNFGPLAAPAVPALVALIDDPNATVSSVAMLTLGSLAYAAAPSIDKLIEATQFEDRRGEAAIRALGMLGPSAAAAISPLVAILRDESKPERRRAVALLALIDIEPDDPAVLDAMDYAATCRIMFARQRVAEEMGQTHADKPRQVRLLIALLGDQSMDVRQMAFLSLARLTPLSEDQVAELARLANDPTFIGWEQAQSALGRALEETHPLDSASPTPVEESRR